MVGLKENGWIKGKWLYYKKMVGLKENGCIKRKWLE